jgi:hypothetical protein
MGEITCRMGISLGSTNAPVDGLGRVGGVELGGR